MIAWGEMSEVNWCDSISENPHGGEPELNPGSAVLDADALPRDHCYVGLVVKASESRVEGSGFDPRLRRGDSSGSSHTSDLRNWHFNCKAPGVLGSALGLVSPVSVYCDWVR